MLGHRLRAPLLGQLRRLCSSSTPAPVTVKVMEDGVAVVTFDDKSASVNTLSSSLFGCFDAVMTQLETDPAIKSAVFISGKKNTFIAGADISMLDAATSKEELVELSHAGQKMMDRIEACPRPIVAAIDGTCMGGGLEVALACHYRIASTNPKTVLSVPEVKLGLLPGAGGTQRLPKLIGIQAALTMATGGGNVRPDKAKRQGLVNSVADPHALLPAALQAARGLADGSVKKATGKKKGLMARLLEDNPIGRNVLFPKAVQMIEKAAGKVYPAPFAIADCIKEGAEKGHAAGSKMEREKFGELGMTTVSKALRGIFFSQTETKKNPYGKGSARPVKTVGVLGAGLMGAGIAQVSVTKGYGVLLKDEFAEGLAKGEDQIKKSLDPKVKRRAMTAFERDSLLSKVIGLTPKEPRWLEHFGRADVVIEAVPENLDLKHKVIQQLEPHLKDNCVFATNTSALPIGDVAKASARPENVVGMHYFSPVEKMPLLEVIPHAGTSDETAATAVEVGYRQGKTVIVVKDVPGFYVNRSLGPFMVESIALQQIGVKPEVLDKALKDFGFPVGPITLADEVGIDVAYHVAAFLSQHLENRMGGANLEGMKALLDAGILGRKTKQGYFTYDAKGKTTRTLNPKTLEILEKYRTSTEGEKMEPAEIANRMSLRFINEAIRCLEDGIIRNPGDGDIGAVFGIGFPPNRGGPFRYVDTVGPQKVVDDMNRFADTVGDWFTPPQMLVDLAKAGKTFHK